MTTAKLTRTAGLCALVAGVLFLLPQFIHPEDKVSEVTTTMWAVAHLVNMTMGLLAIIGLTGLYLRQVREIGVLGLIGFLLFGTGFLMIAIVSFAETVILPQIADVAPRYVNDVLATLVGDPVQGDVGGLALANGIAGATFLLGGLVFGIAMYRAGIVARWAALLLSFGAVASLLVPGVVPDSLMRTATFPTAIAMMGLGYWLWRDQTAAAPSSMPSARGSLTQAGV
ncbi:MAG: hypothetical protein ACRDJ0_05570 [Actinomycetota bacterium]